MWFQHLDACNRNLSAGSSHANLKVPSRDLIRNRTLNGFHKRLNRMNEYAKKQEFHAGHMTSLAG